jgi:hypothetical protein
MLSGIADSRPKAPVVVATGKCDMDGAMTAGEIFDAFKLQELGSGRLFKVIATSSSTN